MLRLLFLTAIRAMEPRLGGRCSLTGKGIISLVLLSSVGSDLSVCFGEAAGPDGECAGDWPRSECASCHDFSSLPPTILVQNLPGLRAWL